MSEDDNPHGISFSESDPNSSIIDKFRSRVSNILPNSLSKWFSPTASTRNDSNNGSLRRRRNSSDRESSSEGSNDESERHIEPPNKRSKSDINQVTLLNIENAPSTSKFDIRRSNTQYRSITEEKNVTHRFASTPTSDTLLNRNRKYLGLNKNVSSTPYDFEAKNPSLANPYVLSNKHQVNDLDEITVDNDSENLVRSESVKARRSIRTGEHVENKFTGFNNKRIKMVNPETSGQRAYESNYMNRRINLLTSRQPSSYMYEANSSPSRTFPEYSNVLLEDEDYVVDEITLPIVETDEQSVNGVQETPPESECSVNSFIDRPESSSRNITNDDEGSNLLRKQYGGLKKTADRSYPGTGCNPQTGISFTSHLQTDKSLFADKNISSSLNNSSMSLNSWIRRPSFNASLYGSTSALSDSKLMNVKSPFYNGKTMYGGSSTYTKNLNHMQKALRVPVQIRPSSALSNVSSSNNSNDNPVLSSTARRILDLMNQFTSPLIDAKKMANANQPKLQSLSNRHHNRFSEEDLQLNRSIRLNSAKSPYNRPNSNNKNLNKSMTTELEIPSIPQLLLKKKLQNNTEQARQIANDSKGIVNTNKLEYKLPANIVGDDEDVGNGRHVTKIRNKIFSIRQEKKPSNDLTPLPELNLPQLSLPAMKSIPKIDIVIPEAVSKVSSITKTTTNLSPLPKFQENKLSSFNLSKNESNQSNFKFSDPITISDADNRSIKSIDNFKFSQPIIVSDNVNIENKTNKMLIPVKKLDVIGTVIEPAESQNQNNVDGFKNSDPKTKAGFDNQILDKFKLDNNYLNTFKKTIDPTFVFPLKTGSVADAFMKFENAKTNLEKKNIESKPEEPIKSFGSQFNMQGWECGSCMIRNKTDVLKCIACETSKPVSPNSKPNTSNNKVIPMAPMKESNIITSDTTFKQLIGKQNEKWECSSCMTRNSLNNNKCLCCQEPKPNTDPSIKTADLTFETLVAKQNEKWECTACMTRNDSNLNKCVCCEQSKAGAVSEISSKIVFGTSSPTFKFGIPVTGAPTVISTQVVVSTANTITNIFGGNILLPSSSQQNFTFGNFSKPAENKTVTVAPTFGNFKPEVSTAATVIKVDSLPETKTVVDSSSKLSSQPLTTEQVKGNGSGIVNPPNPGFTFGLPAIQQKPVEKEIVLERMPTFTFGKPGSISEPSFMNTKTAPIVSTGFTFGATVETVKVSSAVPSPIIPTTNSSLNQPIVGQTQEIQPSPIETISKPVNEFSSFEKVVTSQVQDVITKSSTNALPIFGNINSNVIVTTQSSEIKTLPSFTFGTSVNTPDKAFGSNSSKIDIFSSNNKIATATSSTTFGATSAPNSFTMQHATPTTTSSSTSFIFGAGNNTVAPSTQSAVPAFGVGTNQPSTFGSSTLPSFGNFSTPQSNTNSTFGVSNTFGESNQNNTTKTFGTTPNIFGSTAAVTQSSSFGTVTNMFGTQSQSGFGTTNSVVPTFGSTTPFTNQNQLSEPAAKKPAGFNFGGNPVQEQSSIFTFGAGNTPNFNNNNNSSNNTPPKTSFNFTPNATPSFNFGSTTTNSSQPFAFGATGAPAAGNFKFGSTGNEPAPSNAPFQFGAAAPNNLFATGPANQQARRKIKPARRLPPR